MTKKFSVGQEVHFVVGAKRPWLGGEEHSVCSGRVIGSDEASVCIADAAQLFLRPGTPAPPPPLAPLARLHFCAVGNVFPSKPEAHLALVRIEAPDLAARVEAGDLSLKNAIAALSDRREEARKRWLSVRQSAEGKTSEPTHAS